MKNLTILLAILISTSILSQNQTLLNETWFVHKARDISTNNFFNDSMNTRPELRFEVTFLSDKIVLEGCCGGVFEVEVNYVGNDFLQIVSLTEIEAINCDSAFVLNFYNTIKGAFNSLVGNTIPYQIFNYPQFFYLNINTQNTSYVHLTNSPLEDNDQGTSPYWGQQLPNHQWSLTHVIYEGQTMELPYGAALTIADIYEGTFTISLCGKIMVALNTSWYLDDENTHGPCFISCGILENTVAACEPIAGFSNAYIETFKQNAFDFLSDNLNLTMEYEFTYGTARKLIIKDYSQNRLIFHSNPNYLSVAENDLSPTISIYPNPVQETLHVNLNSNQFATATIFDLQGKKILQHTLESSTSAIDVMALNSGLYFLVLENGNEKVVKKFIKK